ncbi:MAG: hypothetical protein K6G15_05160 [Desulfovibrio sp.]|nr:hypothetical protein [Desulfovibrio sp.]
MVIAMASTPAYKDILETLGKLADWTEQAGKSALPSGPPPAELVEQFNQALAQSPVDNCAVSNAPETTLSVPSGPDKLLADTEPVQVTASEAVEPENPAFEPLRRKPEAFTEIQKVNLERGMENLDAATQVKQDDFLRTAHSLSELLSKPAEVLSPMDLLQAQRLVGVLRIQAEAGQKLSEGVGETLEQLLQQTQA